MRVFEFTCDSAGDPDPIPVPSDIGGRYHRLRVIPPVGHAYTLYDPHQLLTGVPHSVDQVMEILRRIVPGETAGRISNDSGTGTYYGILDDER